jgi:4-hydroxybenzoate polyprenyltransferase
VARILLKLATAIQLTRLTIAFGAVSDIWFIILVTRGDPAYAGRVPAHDAPLWMSLFCGAVIAVGLFAYGAALNDILDLRHDRAFSPDRPIPAGRIRLGQAVVVCVAALLVAVLASIVFGQWSVSVTLLTAAGLLFYNATGKYIPPVSVVTVGLIHAVHMLIPNVFLQFTLPVWMIMTHAMAIALLVHVLEEKRPRMHRRSIIMIAIGWIFWSALVLGYAGWSPPGGWPDRADLAALWTPLLAVAGFVAVASWKVRRVAEPAAAAEKLRRYGAMWQSLYGAAWLFLLDLHAEAAFISLFALAGFAVMTLLKEMIGYSGAPVRYRA